VNDVARVAESLLPRLDEFKRSVTPSSATLVLTHDYPDPDCIASAYGISQLLSFWGTPSTVISFGGFVGRAENRAMIRFLNLHTVPYVLLELKDFDRIVLVDCFPGRSNVSLPPDVRVHAVLDHHISGAFDALPFFHDIRQEIGAASTIVTEYLLAARCPISEKLATALFFGIKTDTGDMGPDSSPEDLECYKRMFALVDHGMLSKIENPDRDVAFFNLLHRAAHAIVAFGHVGYIPLGPIVSPDYVAEMADLFHSMEKIEITVCCGFFKNHLFFSIRSKNRDQAGIYAEKIAVSLGGGGGGHGKLGAGRIPCLKGREEDAAGRFLEQVKAAFNIGTAEGVHIVEDHKRG
jgi:nanoRNase/pAp phosphatase (c-di-AMP/oligoRNAs hydrolase)